MNCIFSGYKYLSELWNLVIILILSNVFILLILVQHVNLVFQQGFTDDQLALVEQNTLMVEEREREIRQIVQSISDLNEIFRDLGAMIVEQVHWQHSVSKKWDIPYSVKASRLTFPDLLLYA